MTTMTGRQNTRPSLTHRHNHMAYSLIIGKPFIVCCRNLLRIRHADQCNLCTTDDASSVYLSQGATSRRDRLHSCTAMGQCNVLPVNSSAGVSY